MRASMGLIRAGAMFVTVSVATPAPVLSQIDSIHLTLVAEIGCDDCDGPEQFGVITAVTVGHGRVVVADRDEPHLRIFSLDGRLLTAMGREGEGPGELRYPLAVGVASDGMSVVDMRLQQVLVLDHTGEERVRGRAGSFPLAAAFAPAGEALYIVIANFQTMTAGVARWDPATRTVKTVLESVEDLRLGAQGEAPLFFSIARAPDGSFALGEGRDVFHIQLHAPNGERRQEVRREIERIPKTETEIEEEREIMARALARMGASPEGVSSMGEIDPLRRHFSVDALRFDGRGRLWVRTDRGRGETVFDVFGQAGDYFGEVRVPGRIRAFGLGDGYLVAGVLGALDLATVRVWRID